MIEGTDTAEPVLAEASTRPRRTKSRAGVRERAKAQRREQRAAEVWTRLPGTFTRSGNRGTAGWQPLAACVALDTPRIVFNPQAAAAAAGGEAPPAAEGPAQQDPSQAHQNGGISVAPDAATEPAAASGVSTEPVIRERRERGVRRTRPPKPPQQQQQQQQRVAPSSDAESAAEARQRLGRQLSWQLARQHETGCGTCVTSSPIDHVRCILIRKAHNMRTVSYAWPDVQLEIRLDQRCFCDRRLLTKRELWSIAGEAASHDIPTKTTAVHNGQHAQAEGITEPVQPADVPRGDAAVPAADRVHPQLTDSAQDDSRKLQLPHSAPEEGSAAAAAAGAPRRGGGRLLDAGRVLEVALDPVTGCASCKSSSCCSDIKGLVAGVWCQRMCCADAKKTSSLLSTDVL